MNSFKKDIKHLTTSFIILALLTQKMNNKKDLIIINHTVALFEKIFHYSTLPLFLFLVLQYGYMVQKGQGKAVLRFML